jgi:hypothetical protein
MRSWDVDIGKQKRVIIIEKEQVESAPAPAQPERAPAPSEHPA